MVTFQMAWCFQRFNIFTKYELRRLDYFFRIIIDRLIFKCKMIEQHLNIVLEISFLLREFVKAWFSDRNVLRHAAMHKELKL